MPPLLFKLSPAVAMLQVSLNVLINFISLTILCSLAILNVAMMLLRFSLTSKQSFLEDNVFI